MNWGSFKSQVLSRIHDTSLAAKVPDWFNEVQLEVLSAAQWRHLDDDATLVTTEPYSTGTASVTAGSTTVTFSGSTIPTNAAGQLLVLDGYYYKIATRDSATQVTLDGNAVTTVSGGTFQIVFNSLDLPSNFSPPRLYQVTLQGAGDVTQLRYTTEHDLFECDADESRTVGKPYVFRLWGNKLQLWPPPNAAYNVKVFYHREPSEMTTSSADADLLDWPDDMQYALLQGTLAVGYEFIDDSNKDACRARFETGLADAVKRNNRKPGQANGRLKRWDSGGGAGRVPYRLPEPIG